MSGRQAWLRWGAVMIMTMGMVAALNGGQPVTVSRAWSSGNVVKQTRGNSFWSQTYQGTEGTCHWHIDKYGVLHIEAGKLDSAKGSWSPWGEVADRITGIAFDGRVEFDRYSGYEFANFGTIDQISGLENVDASNLVDAGAMFLHDDIRGTLDLSSWQTKSLDRTGSMFEGAQVDHLRINKMPVNSLNDTHRMFANSDIKELDLSNWKLPKLERTVEMFEGAQADRIDVSGWETPSLNWVSDMFNGAKNIASLDLSSFDLRGLESYQGKPAFTGLRGMLKDTQKLKRLKLGPNMRLKGPDGATVSLPEPKSSTVYTGKWQQADGDSAAMSSRELMDGYTAVKAGTYVWQTMPAAPVEVQYVDEEQRPLAASVTLQGGVDQTAKLPVRQFPNYEMVSGPEQVTFTPSVQKVRYVYRLKRGRVVVRYLDGLTGKDLRPAHEVSGLAGQSYAVTTPTFSGYHLLLTPENTTGQLTGDTQTLVLVYHPKTPVTPGPNPAPTPSPESPPQPQPEPQPTGRPHLTGQDFSMTVGDPTPTLADFQAQATDQAGRPEAVSLNLSLVNLGRPGRYGVGLSTADGQHLSVALTIRAKQQVVTGSAGDAGTGATGSAGDDLSANAQQATSHRPQTGQAGDTVATDVAAKPRKSHAGQALLPATGESESQSGIIIAGLILAIVVLLRSKKRS